MCSHSTTPKEPPKQTQSYKEAWREFLSQVKENLERANPGQILLLIPPLTPTFEKELSTPQLLKLGQTLDQMTDALIDLRLIVSDELARRTGRPINPQLMPPERYGILPLKEAIHIANKKLATQKATPPPTANSSESPSK